MTSEVPRLMRRLHRDAGRVLYDLDEQREIGPGELADDLRAGGRFVVHDRATGHDCTLQVLAELLQEALPGAGPSPDGAPGVEWPRALLRALASGEGAPRPGG